MKWASVIIKIVNRALLYTSLAVATVAVSWASILIHLAGADPISTAFYRMTFASLFLLPYSSFGLWKSVRKLPGKDIRLLIASGVVLGLHFATWITSLKFTTISNSVVMVATQPFFVAIFEAVIWKEKISSRAIIGMVLAFIGMVVISWSDFNLEGDQLLGDLLAVAGAICAGAYLLIGRKVRVRLDNKHYILPVYSIAALTLLIISFFYHSPLTGFTKQAWIYFLLLGLIPTVFGHSLYNYLLKFIRAHLVGITILGEPVGATILAAIVIGQYPPLSTYVGGVLILSGIFLALVRLKSDKKTPKTA